ncbi:hypothetical protein [Alysiella crassa]|uniref:Uncharacterized protein n=1 Tax=Alysiella crassa TaxID=153491 RepID=A0A376BTT7_9NEIS|nr:hypothetical protein [Alysiella crassa]UOP07884.1 hypothetical protein LVJ80_06030 [Alysiella crassa]SSY79794.1 Uncharacterised protein [Alysiella crassa]
MKPEQLHSWQPQATIEQLSDFIQQNQTLMTLLEEAWQKFAATLPDNPPPTYVSNYGEGIDLETVEHFPISQEEMIEFLNHFEKERYHNDRPFGDSIHINEQDWTLSE